MSADPWLVPVTALRRQAPGARRSEHRSGRVGELAVASSLVPSGAEAEADALLDSVDGGIEVTADIRAPWRGECRRCLRPIEGELHTRVRELYRPRQVYEAETGDEETYPLRGDTLDLRPLVRDALLLELPLAPLCRQDCAGLCPICGVDRNFETCDCAGGTGDPRWAALDVLRERPESQDE